MTSYRCGCQPPTYCPTHRPNPFKCGCVPYATSKTRCDEHRDWPCHREIGHLIEVAIDGPYCPPCQHYVWRSVTLDAQATPTRNRNG